MEPAAESDYGERPEHWRYLSTFKVNPCKNFACEDAECWDYHSYKDRRRLPRYDAVERRFAYAIGLCSSKDCAYPECRFAHNGLEVSFHPMVYKTKMCPGRLTNGRCSDHAAHCSYAHSMEEIRVPAEIYGRRERRSVAIVEPPAPPRASLPPQFQQHPPPSLNSIRTDDPPSPIPEHITSEALFKLYRDQGALQTRLKQLEEVLKRKREAGACLKCAQAERSLVHTACGHAFCLGCSSGKRECPNCGKNGEWIALA